MEVKAWTYHKGWKAPQCAGVIHTDFEKGFIRAEVIKYEDYIKYGSESAVREAGKLGIEGKDYVVQDGDIMHFRFNVWSRFNSSLKLTEYKSLNKIPQTLSPFLCEEPEK